MAIKDFKTFSEVTKNREFAGLYFLCVLDSLHTLAHLASDKFISHPQLVSKLGIAKSGLNPNRKRTVADTLGEYWAGLGNSQDLLAPKQRREICVSLFGSHSEHAENKYRSFFNLRDEFLRASEIYVQNLRTDNKDLLIVPVLDAIRQLKEYIAGLEGDSIEWSFRQLINQAEAFSFPIIRAGAGLYDAPDNPDPAFPYIPDSNAYIVVEQISAGRITRGCIGHLQRVATTGAECLVTAEDFNECSETIDDDTKLLVDSGNNWARALKNLRMSCPNIDFY